MGKVMLSTKSALPGYILLLVSTLVILTLSLLWWLEVPRIVSAGTSAATSQRFFAPATTVSATLLVAVSIGGSSFLKGINPKLALAELVWVFLAALLLVIGLFLSTWGLASGTTNESDLRGLVTSIPLAWLYGSLFFLVFIIFPFVYEPE